MNKTLRYGFRNLSLLMLVLLIAPSARAQMSCGTKLIETGDSVLRLLEACGKPAIGDSNNLDYGEWTYNFGPERFMMKVTIVHGKVETFETLGRGYNDVQQQ